MVCYNDRWARDKSGGSSIFDLLPIIVIPKQVFSPCVYKLWQNMHFRVSSWSNMKRKWELTTWKVKLEARACKRICCIASRSRVDPIKSAIYFIVTVVTAIHAVFTDEISSTADATLRWLQFWSEATAIDAQVMVHFIFSLYEARAEYGFQRCISLRFILCLCLQHWQQVYTSCWNLVQTDSNRSGRWFSAQAFFLEFAHKWIGIGSDQVYSCEKTSVRIYVCM